LCFAALGVRVSNTVTMLQATDYILPFTTFVVGYAGGQDPDPGIVFSDAICESLTITGRVEQKIQVRVTFVGNGAFIAAAGFTFPICQNTPPLRFNENFSFFLNGVEYTLNTRVFDLN